MKKNYKYRFALLAMAIFLFAITAQAQSTVFQPAVNYQTGTHPFGVTTGDFNNDGKKDLVTTNADGNSLSVLLGNGNGTFQAANTFALPDRPLWTAAGDFNGDGKIDLAVTAQYNNGISVLFGKGDGTFQNPVSYPTVSRLFAYPIVAGDLNNDNKSDLIVLNYFCYQCPSSFSVFLADPSGNGTFQNAITAPTGGSGSQSIDLGDINRDGKTDIIISNADTDNLTVKFGNNDGTFQSSQTYSTGRNPVSVKLAKINQDNILDLTVSVYFTNQIEVRFGNADGTFQNAIGYATGNNPGQVVSEDFDLNGSTDLAVTNINGKNLSLLYNNGNGTFQNAANYTIGTQPFSLVASDFNGDGRMDLSAANRDNNNVSILLNATTPDKQATRPGLISWWRGEGNSLDSWGTNHGALQNSATFAPGKDGYAFKFLDHSSQMKVNSQVYEMPSGSISAWINWDGVHQQNWVYANVMFGSWQGGETSSPVVMVYYGTFWWQFSSTIYYGARWNTNIPVVPGQWHHVAVTYKDNTAIDGTYLVKFYVDGRLADSANLNNPIDFRDEFGIGTAAGIGGGFSGLIDEVQIYNRPLSDCEVAFLHNSNSGCGGGTTIDPQAVTRPYKLYNNDTNTFLGEFSGTKTLNLPAGSYSFDNGEGVGASAFAFTVDQFGQVSGVSNPVAAEGVGNTLRLKNATFNVDPQAYTGNYFFGKRNVFYTGTQTFTVVPGLRYGIDSGAGIAGANGQSYFYFDVGAGGAISNVNIQEAAYGNGSTLVFNNKTLIVEPNGYAGDYNLTSHIKVRSGFTGRQSIVLIPGLIYLFDFGAHTYDLSFKFDANGSPVNLAPAGIASGIGNILVLANISVRIEPVNYTGNYRFGSRFLNGVQNLVLVPNARYFIGLNSAEYFTPTETGVAPSSVTVSNGTNNYTFNLSINQSCPPQVLGLISSWRGEGNALDSVGANHGTLVGNVQYTAAKTGQGFKFQNFFNDWVKINSQVLEMQGGTVSTWFNWDGNEPAGWFSALVILGSWQGGNTSSPVMAIKYGTFGWQYGNIGGDTQIPIVPGRWYHTAMTYDGNHNVRVYLNGVLVGGGSSINPGDFRDEFGIGRGAGVTAVGIGGVVDETQIYNRPLSDCEIRNLYNSANGLPCEVCDNQAPTTNAVGNPVANPAGWNNSNVGVSLAAADNPNGTGVKEIVYSASGAQTIAQTVVSGSNANLQISNEGVTTVTYFARDNAGNAENPQTIIVRIDKTAPIISNLPTIQTAEATSTNGSVVSWNSPTATDNLDPNVSVVCAPVSGGTFAIGTTEVVCTSIDRAGNSKTASFNVTVADTTAPTISNLPANQSVVATSAAGAQVSWNAPTAADTVDGDVAVVCSPASGGTFAHGETTVACTATDSRGNAATRSFKVEVKNAPPTANAGGPYEVGEGAAILLSGGGSDVENTPLNYAWDLNNDGTFETIGQNPQFSAVGLDGPANRIVKLKVTDAGGLSAVSAAIVNVFNVAPTLHSIFASLAPQTIGSTINLTLNYTDPAGSLDTYAVSVNWGDGTIDNNASHVYSAAGVYRLRATVSDEDGGSSNEAVFEYVVVYDPTGGFVTGGGWILSPANAFPANPSLTGKATFGFVSKYQRGANVPSGNTEFQFRAADFRFKSDAYEWLVVAGARAQYKGTGSVNGVSGYSFLLTATDGQQNGGGGMDRFRIKIWNDSGIVYDNQMGALNETNPQAISGGSIVIHQNN